MDRSAFLKELAKQFYPVLRAEGFKGSGSTLRRIREPVIHVVNFQGSSTGDRCYVNLGAHLTFLPPEGGLPVALERLQESHCAFRDRLDPPPGSPFGWHYGESADEMMQNIAFLCDDWGHGGHKFFDRHSIYPDSFVALIDEGLRRTPQPYDCKTLALIALEIGLIDKAAGLAREGLNKCPERASSLQRDLEGILSRAVPNGG